MTIENASSYNKILFSGGVGWCFYSLRHTIRTKINVYNLHVLGIVESVKCMMC